MLKRILTLMLVGTFLAAISVGCGGDDEAEEAEEATDAVEEATE